MSFEPIAIVGAGGLFPDSPDLESFWRLIEGGRCAAREVPQERWAIPKDLAFDPAKGAPDKVYSLKACLLGETPVEEGLPAGLDPVFHLAVRAARLAWSDARMGKTDKSRVGVIFGNLVLPVDGASALTRDLLLPAFEEGALGLSRKSGRAPVWDNRRSAGLPAGLVAKALGLGGGAYTLDAACASSLYAVALACAELHERRADAVLAGGVSRPESLYTQMGFSQLRALSASGVPAPFDAAADGLVVGEGAGLFLLKRLEDARSHGDRIRGVIAGAGLSNDVGGSLLAPNTPGQLRAMREAYRRAGWSPSQVDYVECHATGTPTGDPVEVASLKALWGERGWTAGQCAIGSVKSNVGHLLTAAGSAGLMKVLLAMEKKTLPPTANLAKPSAALGLEGSPFRVSAKPEPWKEREGPRRAAISAFGFGGINAHVLVEEYKEAPLKKSKAKKASPAVAIIGMEVRVGPLGSTRAFQEAVLSGKTPAAQAVPAARCFGAKSEALGRWLPQAGLSAKDYRIPPKEMEEMLPQQTLMLDAAAKALADARLSDEGRERRGVFIGLGLDLNSTNFGFRWQLAARARDWAAARGWTLTPSQEKEWTAKLREAAGPALSANRTMGALGSVVASRIAREFQIGGPSFTVSSEDTSALRALELGVRALQRGELDSALVGGVEIADARALLGRSWGAGRAFEDKADGAVPTEGAVALVLKRLDDARRDGDRVYAVVKGLSLGTGDLSGVLRRAYEEAQADPSTVGYLEADAAGDFDSDRTEACALSDFFGTAPAPQPIALGSVKAQLGHAGCASGLLGVAKAALALYQEILPPMPLKAPVAELEKAAKRFHAPRQAQYWLRNRAEGPRRAGVTCRSEEGGCGHVVLEALEGQDSPRVAAERLQPLGARSEGLFRVEEDTPAALVSALERLRRFAAAQDAAANVEAMARSWHALAGQGANKKLAAAVVARDWRELLALIQDAEDAIRDNPERPVSSDRIHFTWRAPFGAESLSFVFPGSGNQYLGMGQRIGAEWPELLRAQDAENGYLRDQLVPRLFSPWRLTWKQGWEQKAERDIISDFKALIFASVAHGTVMSDLIRSFGVSPKASIGYSLGETAGLFASRAWRARDEMLRRMNASSLFVSDLAGPCDAARQFWHLPKDEKVDWVLGVIDRPADHVKRALKGMERAGLLIVNAPLECVVGGYKQAVDSLVEGLGCVFLPLQGVSTVHFPAAKLVEKKYRDLHVLPTEAPEGVRFYSGAWAKSYPLTKDSAADSITAQAIRSFDFSALIRRAYEDGCRLFVELGPQASCTRMIGKILGPLPHMARSACVRGQDEVSTVLKLLAQLSAERVPVDLNALYGRPTHVTAHQAEVEVQNFVSVPLGGPAPRRVDWKPGGGSAPVAAPKAAVDHTPRAVPRSGAASLPAAAIPPAPVSVPGRINPAPQPAPVLTGTAAAHAVFLRMSQRFTELQTKNLSFIATGIVPEPMARPEVPVAPQAKPVFMDKQACMEFAIGSIAKVLGPEFAQVDTYPTRVRLPDAPLMLVDRITEVEGVPRSLKNGRCVTEHDVKEGAWYLDGGRIPTCIAVEAGQADLFLSGYLGIDFETKGLAVYRLLDAEVTFHGPLPRPGQTIRYDIKIERFTQLGDIWLFFFNFEGTVDGKPLISMRKGCAGFFTQEELARGKGVVLTEEDKAPWTVKRPKDLEHLAPPADATFVASALNRLPKGRMKLVDRITTLDLQKGLVIGEADIHPDDWHLVCHFKDDNVMPGTLMYECCMHTLRVYLMGLGWDGEVWEPKPGVMSKLECRGQVLASTKKVTYEIRVKELGYGPEPFAIADALMYSDGKLIVRISNMSVRVTGGEVVHRTFGAESVVNNSKPLYGPETIRAFAVGKPSDAFGEPYKVFDQDRVIARLPGPPYQFLDRVVEVGGGKPFVLAPGAWAVAEYDVPPDEWYFKENAQPTMPFAVLLEVALQPCGWLAAWCGSALTSPIDLKFRNLGGTATQFMEIGPDIGTLTTRVKLTKVSQSGGMIIQSYEMEMTRGKDPVYKGTTEFGFFTKEALGQQIGLRGAKPHTPSGAPELMTFDGMPGPKLLMLDKVEAYPDGYHRGVRKVDPKEWFFAAHFYQDPVCPGSLGLESFIQLMKLYAIKKWGQGRFENMVLGKPHTWVYRGQYTPVNKEVVVEALIKESGPRELTAEGYLKADGLTIYQMKDFTLKLS